MVIPLLANQDLTPMLIQYDKFKTYFHSLIKAVDDRKTITTMQR